VQKINRRFERWSQNVTASDRGFSRGPLIVPSANQGKRGQAKNQQTILFVTFRLADSLPRELLDDWLRASSSLKLRRTSRDAFLAANPPPWDDLTEACYHGPFSDKLDEHLDNITDATQRDPTAPCVIHASLAFLTFVLAAEGQRSRGRRDENRRKPLRHPPLCPSAAKCIGRRSVVGVCDAARFGKTWTKRALRSF